MVNQLLKHTPFIGSAYGFGAAAVEVYNSTSVMGATKAAIKKIVGNCTTSVWKYSVLCSTLLVNGVLCTVTRMHPLAVSIFLQNSRLIIET